MTYEYKKRKFGAFEKFTFRHKKTKNGFSIVPACGANVTEIFFGKHQILDGHESPEELAVGKWSKGDLLFPFPNRLQDGRYQWLGETYHFPINNAATNNAIHGMVKQAKFEVIRISLTEVAAEITCRYAYKGENPSYPFPFALQMTYGISNNNRFRLSFDVLNQHNQPIPAGFGWHPYFALSEKSDTCSLSLPNCAEVEIDHRMIPTGHVHPFNAWQRPTFIGDAFFDTCFSARTERRYKLNLKGEKGRLSLCADPMVFPYFQVFTPPHRQSVALEPMTCNIDTFNNKNGLQIIEPGGIWKGAFYMEFAE